jgi:hypothetical protein
VRMRTLKWPAKPNTDSVLYSLAQIKPYKSTPTSAPCWRLVAAKRPKTRYEDLCLQTPPNRHPRGGFDSTQKVVVGYDFENVLFATSRREHETVVISVYYSVSDVPWVVGMGSNWQITGYYEEKSRWIITIVQLGLQILPFWHDSRSTHPCFTLDGVGASSDEASAEDGELNAS